MKCAKQDTMRLEAIISQSRSFPYGPFYLSFFTTQASYRSDGARKLLAWRPRVDRQTAMKETLKWIERANPGKDSISPDQLTGHHGRSS
jgi:hypothetical protein